MEVGGVQGEINEGSPVSPSLGYQSVRERRFHFLQSFPLKVAEEDTFDKSTDL
jgi:hypothetical protein